jgi:ferredoxin-NADP reductase
MSLEWQQGTIIKIVNETKSTRRYWIEMSDMEIFDFKPGQFVTLDLPIHEKKNKRWRSYSIASAPDGSNVFELVIVLVKDGLGTPYLWENIAIGDKVSLRGPAGVFVLPESINQDLFMICTGTGVAPFRSMIHYINKHQIQTKNIYLIFGTRTQEDLLYFNELKELEKSMPNFHYFPTLSREEWEGHHGYVHSIYKELAVGKPNASFLLCGWRNMIDEARQNLTEMGYDKSQVHFELYG